MSLLHKFVQSVPFAGIEIVGRNWDRSWVTRIGIKIWLQESGSKLGYRNRDQNLVTGIGIEVGDEVGRIEVEIELKLVHVVMYCW